MRKILITAAAAAMLAASLAQAQPQPAPQPAPVTPAPAQPAPGDAPADPGAALVKDRCTMCHDTDIIAASPRPAAAWGDLVASMVRRGAQLNDDEKAQVVAYLAKTYSTPAGT
ncbi:MAG: hypothetical protein JSR98_08415 [Proteobacteria bacterium]|nr:hypothetical protein [Pseudomonadota bacterium]